MTKTIAGGCLCGSVRFEVQDSFENFYFCHCEQCRRVTGSSHASNAITHKNNIVWTKGEKLTVRFDHPSGAFTKVFCSRCGSGLPHDSQNGKDLVVPVGCLDTALSLSPNAQIFCSEKTEWFRKGVVAPEYLGFMTEEH
ncbi:GFA family protein [Vibrio mediterranei]|uniref:GFA family protein n=1 Tax=Vibrio mediterranei TaxID=689 RepID=UPI00148DEF98|nr:GFA family protein [Vibrio mediterranei]NOH31482.1 GFA family protein [Vibrio mediterranei]NOI26528.1 GFA family protein [Vibrio mediterranei]